MEKIFRSSLLLLLVLAAQLASGAPDTRHPIDEPPVERELVVNNAGDLRRCTEDISKLILKVEVTASDIANAQDASGVEYLQITGWQTPTSLLAKLPELMPKLQQLRIGKCAASKAADFTPLAELPDLVLLEVENFERSSPQVVPAIEKFKALEFLHLDASGMPKESLQSLGRLPLGGLTLWNLDALAKGELEATDTSEFSHLLKDLALHGLKHLPSTLKWLLPLKDSLITLAITGEGDWAQNSLVGVADLSLRSITMSNVTVATGLSTALGKLGTTKVSLTIVGDSSMLLADWLALVKTGAVSRLSIVQCKSVTGLTVDGILDACKADAPEVVYVSSCPLVTAKAIADLQEEWGEERVVLLD